MGGGRILVAGAGAIGGLLAARAAAAGLQVRLLCATAESSRALADQGIIVRRVARRRGFLCGARRAERHEDRIGETPVKVQAVSDPAMLGAEDGGGPFDFIFLAARNADIGLLAGRLDAFRSSAGVFVVLQNGMRMDEALAAAGADLVLGCSIGFAAQRSLTSQGAVEIAITSGGRFELGTAPGAAGDSPARRAVQDVRSILALCAPTLVVSDIRARLYAKLLINACITGLRVLSGLDLGTLLARPRARMLCLEIVREGLAAAGRLGIDVPPYGGRFDFHRFAAAGPAAALYRRLLLAYLSLKYRGLESASLAALARGERTEIDHINGFIAAACEAPVNAGLVRLVHEIEAGRRPIDPRNLDELPPV